jgi:hypothetical protein
MAPGQELRAGQAWLQTEATLIESGWRVGGDGVAAVGRVLGVAPPLSQRRIGQRILFVGRHRPVQACDLLDVRSRAIGLVLGEDDSDADALAARAVRRALRAYRAPALKPCPRIAILGDSASAAALGQLFEDDGSEVVWIGRDERAGAAPVPVVFVASSTPDCLEQALLRCRSHGEVLLLDRPLWTSGREAVELLRKIHFGWLRVRAIAEWEPEGSPPDGAVREALDLVRRGAILSEERSAPRLRPADLPVALRRARRGDGPYIVDWTGAKS